MVSQHTANDKRCVYRVIGAEFVPNLGPNETPNAYGLLIGAGTKKVRQKKFTTSDLIAVGETATVKEM